MKRTLKAIVVALLLAGGLSLTPGCAANSGAPSVFVSDPVGATLVTVKDAYESSVRTAGRLYVQKLITEPQLRNFRDKAYVVYNNYNVLLALHENGLLTASDKRLTNLTSLSNALIALVNSFNK